MKIQYFGRRKKEQLFAVDWIGPYPQTKLTEVNDTGILYAATGGTKTDSTEKFRYCGITDLRFKDRIKNHRKLDMITVNKQVWLGWLNYPRRLRPRRDDLEIVESLIIYFWGDLLNVRKSLFAPKTSMTLISRWFIPPDWKSCTKTPSILDGFHNVISWDAERKLWQTADFKHNYSDY